MNRCKYNKRVGCNAKEECNNCEIHAVYQQGRADAIKEFIDRFNKSTIIMGRAAGRTFMLKCLNDIAKQIRGEADERS